MYSVLIKKGTNNFVYAVDETTGQPFTGSLAETKTFFNELLQKYPISQLSVVHNTTINADLTIADVE